MSLSMCAAGVEGGWQGQAAAWGCSVLLGWIHGRGPGGQVEGSWEVLGLKLAGIWRIWVLKAVVGGEVCERFWVFVVQMAVCGGAGGFCRINPASRADPGLLGSPGSATTPLSWAFLSVEPDCGASSSWFGAQMGGGALGSGERLQGRAMWRSACGPPCGPGLCTVRGCWDRTEQEREVTVGLMGFICHKPEYLWKKDDCDPSGRNFSHCLSIQMTPLQGDMPLVLLLDGKVLLCPSFVYLHMCYQMNHGKRPAKCSRRTPVGCLE